jgi:hypothetical protein
MHEEREPLRHPAGDLDPVHRDHAGDRRARSHHLSHLGELLVKDPRDRRLDLGPGQPCAERFEPRLRGGGARPGLQERDLAADALVFPEAPLALVLLSRYVRQRFCLAHRCAQQRIVDLGKHLAAAHAGALLREEPQDGTGLFGRDGDIVHRLDLPGDPDVVHETGQADRCDLDVHDARAGGIGHVALLRLHLPTVRGLAGRHARHQARHSSQRDHRRPPAPPHRSPPPRLHLHARGLHQLSFSGRISSTSGTVPSAKSSSDRALR